MERKRSLAAAYEEGQQQMEKMHAGEHLSAAVDEALAQLASGDLTLLSTSIEGAAIAAACTVNRPGATWRLVDLTWQPRVNTSHPIVFIEPMDPGRAWRSAVSSRYSDATVIICGAPNEALLRAA